ncbi:MAG: peptidyl-prolyl cis-trans isomerase SurA [Holosporales bacterium]|jgi:parvulin-like peptidyl-prolyl isomerase|nr:peptidyl-prolyl cis-trans isomerase SurA [Holosporales bacterium]
MNSVTVRLFLSLLFFAIIDMVTGACSSSIASNQTSDQASKQLPKDKNEDSFKIIPMPNNGNEFNTKQLGKSVTELNVLQENQSEYTSLTNSGGSSALRALAVVSRHSKRKASKGKSFTTVADSQKDCFVVAKVNNEVVTNIDVINWIKFIFFSSGKKYDKGNVKLMAPQVVKAMTDMLLQQQYARLYSIKVSDIEVMNRVHQIAAANSMTLDELKAKFKECGISMEIFKRQMKSRMLLQCIVQLIGGAGKVSEQELVEAKRKETNDIKYRRYHLREIFFRVDNESSRQKARQCAEAVLKLLQEGFDFLVLSESMSQGTYTGDIGDLGSLRESLIEKAVLAAVKGKSPGARTVIIETKTGYKIVYIEDIAEPGHVGMSRATYHVLRSDIQFQGGFLTQKDIARLNEASKEIAQCETPEQYEACCKKYKIVCEKQDINSPNPYELELVSRSKGTHKPAMLRSLDDENKITIFMYVGETVPPAAPTTNDEIRNELSAKKIAAEFNRNYKKMQAMAHTEIYDAQVEKICG